MACAQRDGVGCASEVKVVGLGLDLRKAFSEAVDFVSGSLLQFVDFNADILLLICSHVAEVGH